MAEPFPDVDLADAAVCVAKTLPKDPDNFRKYRELSKDLTWKSPALKAEEVYEKILLKRTTGVSHIFTGLDWWDEFAGPLRRGNTYVICGYAGVGKAQPLDVEIQTPKGTTVIGELKPGALVIGSDGKSTRVTGVFRQGKMLSYTVELSDGSKTKCSKDHLWTTLSRYNSGPRSNKTETLTTEEIIRRGIAYPCGLSRYKIPVCGPVEYSNPRPEFAPYAIGAIIGDAGTTGSVIDLASNDPEIPAIIAGLLPEGFELVKRMCGSCYHYTIKDNKPGNINRLNRHLKDLGLKCKSIHKFIPKEYLYAPIPDRVELLRGLMDTDGSISPTGNRVSFYTSSEHLCLDVLRLIRSLGGTGTYSCYDRGEGRNAEFSVRFRIGINPFRLKRKASVWRKSEKMPPARYIKSITPNKVEEHRCISVAAPNGLYLTDDFICTHNTTLAIQLAWNLALTGKKVWFYCLELSAPEVFEVLAGHICGNAIVTKEQECSAYSLIQDTGFRFYEPNKYMTWEQRLSEILVTTKKEELDVVFIDNLGYLTRTLRGSVEVEGMVSAKIKSLSQELEIPIVTLHHLRKPDGEVEFEPNGHAIKGSSAIIQDASDAFILHHPLNEFNEAYSSTRNPVGYLLSTKPRWGGGGVRFVRLEGMKRLYTPAMREEYPKPKKGKRY